MLLPIIDNDGQQLNLNGDHLIKSNLNENMSLYRRTTL